MPCGGPHLPQGLSTWQGPIATKIAHVARGACCHMDRLYSKPPIARWIAYVAIGLALWLEPWTFHLRDQGPNH